MPWPGIKPVRSRFPLQSTKAWKEYLYLRLEKVALVMLQICHNFSNFKIIVSESSLPQQQRDFVHFSGEVHKTIWSRVPGGLEAWNILCRSLKHSPVVSKLNSRGQDLEPCPSRGYLDWSLVQPAIHYTLCTDKLGGVAPNLEGGENKS